MLRTACRSRATARCAQLVTVGRGTTSDVRVCRRAGGARIGSRLRARMDRQDFSWHARRVAEQQAGASGTRRVFILDFDSVAQTRVFRGGSDADAARTLIGQLRLALLLYDQVFVTHAMLLDGQFFRRVGPDECAQVLGCSPRDLPVTVLAPNGGVADALAGMVDSETFIWQTGVPSESDAALRAWVGAAEDGRVGCEPYASPATAAGAPFLRTAHLAHVAPDVSDAGRALLERAAASASRSAAFAVFDAPGEVERSEIERLRAWYDREYLQEVAERNSAAWLSFGELPQAVKSRAQLAVPQDALTFCELAPPATYAQARYGTRDLRNDFATAHSRAGLLSLAFATLESSAAERNLRHRMVMPVVRLVSALATIVMGALALAPTAASWWLPLASFAVLALTTVPWSDLRLFIELRRFAQAATLSVAVTAERHG